MRKILLATLFALVSLPAAAQMAAERIVVSGVWVRLNAPGTTATGVFMTLNNNSSQAAAIVRAESPVAAMTELHRHSSDNGVMKMRPVPAIAIPAGAETRLQPGGLHVMLIDLNTPLREGEAIRLKLVFADGSSKLLQAVVRRPGHENKNH